ncbi:condensation domain-containing protein, partial [Anaerosporobacter sp.]
EEEIPLIIKQFVRPFNLKNPPLIRVGILKVGNEKNMLLYDIHHIITDGSSFQILNRDLVSISKEEELVSLPVTYKDYAVWENKREASETFKHHEEYWLSEFEEEVPQIPWPYFNSCPENREAIYDEIVIAKDQLEVLNQLAKETGSTLFMILLGSLSITLSKISGQDNMIIGSVEAGRNNSQIQDVIGVFINNFAIKTRVIDNNTFREYLKQVKDKVMNAYEHQEYPYDKLIEILKYTKRLSDLDLFNTMLVLENIKGQDVNTEGFALEPYNHIRTEAKYDLYVGGIQYEDEIVLGIEFCAGVFDEKARTSFKKHWERVLADICKNADQKIKTMDCEVIQQPESEEESSYDADFDF